MNNSDVDQLLTECERELLHLKNTIDTLGPTNLIAPYLSKYSVIRACGTIETSFKAVIADFCSKRTKRQVKRFIDRKVRESSANPSFAKMCEFLDDFDKDWKKGFKSAVSSDVDAEQIRTSLQSLVDARNEFAHGGHPTVTINDVINYFSQSRRAIEMMDIVVA